MSNSNPNASPKTIPPQILNQIIANQSKELEIRGQEIDLRKTHDQHQLEFAKQALQARLESEKNLMLNANISQKNKFIFSGILAVVFVLFLCFAIYFKAEQIAMEMVKAVIYLVAGALGGSAWTRQKYSKEVGRDK